MNEPEIIRTLFEELRSAPLRPFPGPRSKLDAPIKPGVYVIYGAKGRVLHVGRTPRGLLGLRQRLTNHLHGMSSFTKKYLKRNHSKLRAGCGFRCVIVKNPRRRALLEFFATGALCPAHLGLSEVAVYKPIVSE
jgi:excinuclease UvrABC nuclease subunit